MDNIAVKLLMKRFMDAVAPDAKYHLGKEKIPK
jgi:hypothetical protein